VLLLKKKRGKKLKKRGVVHTSYAGKRKPKNLKKSLFYVDARVSSQ
jgi:hypothetical protein